MPNNRVSIVSSSNVQPSITMQAGDAQQNRGLLLRQLARQNSALSTDTNGSEESAVFHEIMASKFQDPVTGEDVIMIIQTDVTERVQTEEQLQRVLEAETRWAARYRKEDCCSRACVKS